MNYYPHEVFSLAIEVMATSTERLQERIREAYNFNLFKFKRFEQELPPEIRDQFIKLSELAETGEILKLNDEEARLLAKEILHMAHVIRENYYKEVCKRKLF